MVPCLCLWCGLELSPWFAGWYIAFYKNGIGPPDTHVGATLFIKLDGTGDDEKMSWLGAEGSEREVGQQPREEGQGYQTEEEEKESTNSFLVRPDVEGEETGKMNIETSDVKRVDVPNLRDEAEREALFRSDIASAISTEGCRGESMHVAHAYTVIVDNLLYGSFVYMYIYDCSRPTE